HPRSAVTVIVDDGLGVELLRFEDEARVTMRTQADCRPNDSIPGSADRREVESGARRDLDCRSRPTGVRGRATAEPESEKRHAAGLEQRAPVHDRPPRLTVVDFSFVTD